MDFEERKKMRSLAVALAKMISEYYSLDLETKNANIKLKKTDSSFGFHFDFYVFIWNDKELPIPEMIVKHFPDYITEGKFNINIKIRDLQEFKRLFESYKPDESYGTHKIKNKNRRKLK